MKIKNSYIKLGLLMFLGFLTGIFGASIGRFLIGKVRPGMSDFLNMILHNILWIQIAVATIFGGGAIFNYVMVKRLFINYHDDDEQLIERIETKQNMALIFNSVNYILSFTLFGIAVDISNQWIIVSVIVFLLAVITSSFMDISVVNQVKKIDPMKKGDPANNNFEKEWIESCDEAEKLIIYQASYQSFKLMKYILLASIILTVLSKIGLGTGNFPIVLIGAVWLLQTISFSLYSTKNQKNKLNL